MKRWLVSSFCSFHPRNRRWYLIAFSLLCTWFVVLAYERHLAFKESSPYVLLDKAQVIERLVPDGHVSNNGRVPKQVDQGSQDVDQTTTLDGAPSTVAGTVNVVKIISTNLPVPDEQQPKEPVSTTTPEVVYDLPNPATFTSPEDMQRFMLKHNSNPTVYNKDSFAPMGPDDLVLVVQVHKREKYLRLLLDSLRHARGVEKVLLVVSHDFYDQGVNEAVKSVDFCKVLQLFYPLSLQVVPHKFPGSSDNDCPRDASRVRAIGMNCTNALHPDTYGHYREAIVTAIKHHWWWKLNTVFDGLELTDNFSGYVFFLEEDHYVSPDFLHVAQQMIQMKQLHCQQKCDFINLGMYINLRSFGNHVSVGIWNAGKNNMGFGMDRATWNSIKKCSKYFCTYDDYNWDWSLNQLGKACPSINRDLQVLVIKSARVFHIGTCGTHHKRSCNEERDANIVRTKIKSHEAGLFPKSLVLDYGVFPALSRRKLKPYGGWGDVRDHELCLNIAKGKYLT